ncbi:MAG TPA: response regulator transcription factor [Rhizomicrobium sp.]|nr:response regulator transcription factor [Rhizomicrobium sp.]
MKLLLIEDDPDTARFIVKSLREHHHTVDHAADGAEGLTLAGRGGYDTLIVDRMLPALDGLSLVRNLRASGDTTPVLFLTTMTSIEDRVEGLEAGGDDYLVKPFAMAELLARLNALGRRPQAVSPRIVVGELELDLMKRAARQAGHAVDLQPQEFRLLEYLAQNAGRTVTRTMLLEHVWDLHFDPGSNIVESHMSRLRAKLDRGTRKGHDLIQTIRGVGYSFRAD